MRAEGTYTVFRRTSRRRLLCGRLGGGGRGSFAGFACFGGRGLLCSGGFLVGGSGLGCGSGSGFGLCGLEWLGEDISYGCQLGVACSLSLSSKLERIIRDKEERADADQKCVRLTVFFLGAASLLALLAAAGAFFAAVAEGFLAGACE